MLGEREEPCSEPGHPLACKVKRPPKVERSPPPITGGCFSPILNRAIDRKVALTTAPSGRKELVRGSLVLCSGQQGKARPFSPRRVEAASRLRPGPAFRHGSAGRFAEVGRRRIHQGAFLERAERGNPAAPVVPGLFPS